jgi:hypothetical protein
MNEYGIHLFPVNGYELMDSSVDDKTGWFSCILSMDFAELVTLPLMFRANPSMSNE